MGGLRTQEKKVGFTLWGKMVGLILNSEFTLQGVNPGRDVQQILKIQK